ncbi:hypothetical protein GUJ93_ZPchr0006g43201 [Zizania palustris]|uniref:Uncharacterized protein n=1 Tax=Zizania palustris TaxID=103762 RepID=A0A8J5T2N9_ZIZPA|nr:hypothetical protein GUJ93_ZPchr0006g43201 [Zizania palustris]
MLRNAQALEFTTSTQRPTAVLQPPLAAASDRLRPHRRHHRDRRRPLDLGHTSVGQEDRRIAVAVEHPNLSIVYPRHRPCSVDRSPHLRAPQDGISADLTMSVYQVHSYCRHFEGFIKELRMMLTFLGFLFEPEFQGVYVEEFAGPCDRTPGAYRSIYLGVHSVCDPVMARQSRLLQAMDDLHTELVLDADEHHEAVEFLRVEMKNLIQ